MKGIHLQAVLFASTGSRYRISIAALTFQNGLEKVALPVQDTAGNAGQCTQTVGNIEKLPLLLVRKIGFDTHGFLPTSIVDFPKYLGVD